MKPYWIIEFHQHLHIVNLGLLPTKGYPSLNEAWDALDYFISLNPKLYAGIPITVRRVDIDVLP